MDRLYLKAVLTPAGTQIAAPVITLWPLEDVTLRKIEITVPPGHNGLTGFRILWSGQQIIPWANNQYLVANGRVITVSFDDYITVSALSIQTYNLDIFDHTFYFEATVTDTTKVSINSVVSATAPSIVPGQAAALTDPLSIDALLGSLPPDVAAELQTDLASVTS